ncbi:CubicO group peptidase (beta-lactamase class C family) [Dyadobacter jejuensis]|uniref:CubicO group peptidase (Beta-lactamase class C family) n=2 Tax=Dyadobacter jejuensis TaxID=1082580 RepID=A0A316AKN4_9BACT|nr:CubicO group peptidase (beta-lactamase class C family) [Dyadobacter jejuensis]
MRNVQPKVWWGLAALSVILVTSWGLTWKEVGAADRETVYSKAEERTLDPKPVLATNPEMARKISEIEAIFQRKRRGGFNGNVLVVQNDTLLYSQSFGYGHLKDKDSLNKDSRFQLASLSKPITAVAMLKLVQEGRVSLSDSVQRFFPDFPYPGVKIDLLLSHRSGLPNYIYSFPDSVRHGQGYPSNQDIMHWYATVKPTPQRYNLPDRSFVYCNTNYCVLAAIIEKVTGQTFGQYLQESIFSPLGMDQTFLVTDTTAAAMANRTVGHQYGRRIAKDYYDGVVGDKGLYSTTGDIYKFYNGLSKGLILSDSLRNEAFTPRSFEKRGIRNYGYGFRMHTNPDRTPLYIYHGGWWKGYNTILWVSPQSKSVIVVLSNSYNRATYDIKGVLAVLEGGDGPVDIEKEL